MTLADTSAWVEFLRATGSPADVALGRLLERRAPVYTTDVVVAELLAGADDEDAARRLGGLVSSLERRPPPGPLEVERAAYLYRLCRAAGEPVREAVP